jgi:hypothetical protein
MWSGGALAPTRCLPSLESPPTFVAPAARVLARDHNRLPREKDQLLLSVERRVTHPTTGLYARIGAVDFAGTAPLTVTMRAHIAARQRLPAAHQALAPQLLRGFVSALLLPVVAYLVTRVALTG